MSRINPKQIQQTITLARKARALDVSHLGLTLGPRSKPKGSDVRLFGRRGPRGKVLKWNPVFCEVVADFSVDEVVEFLIKEGLLTLDGFEKV